MNDKETQKSTAAACPPGSALLDCFPFYVCGYECESEDEAWESFKCEAKRQFKWIAGIKVWRCTPELYRDKRFDEDKNIFIVRARALSFDELPAGMSEATIDGPYTGINNDPFPGVIGFAI